MIELLKSLTNREIASLFYIGLFLLFILIRKDIRKSLFQVLAGMWGVKGTLLLAISFISINIFIVNIILGKYDILKEIIIWCFVIPFPLLLEVNKIKEDINYFKKIVKNSIRLMVIIVFIVNTYTFGIIGEIILLFFMLIFTIMSVYSGDKKEYKQVKIFSDYVLIFLGIIIFVLAINGFISETDKILATKNIYTFFTPVVLTILFFPFLYFFALIMEYENLIIRIKFFKGKELSKYKLFFYLFNLCNFNIYKLNKFSKYYSGKRIGNTEEYFLNTISEFKINN